MSRSPYFFVERYNEERDRYEFQHPIIWNWNHTKQEPADLYPYNGSHDLFSIVECEYNSDLPEMKGIKYGLPKNCCDEIKEMYEKCSYMSEPWQGDIPHMIRPKVRWFTYADMLIYCLEYPKVKDYEDEVYYSAGEDEKIKPIFKDTPMISLKNRVDAFLEVMDDWDWKNDYSNIRIVYWILI